MCSRRLFLSSAIAALAAMLFAQAAFAIAACDIERGAGAPGRAHAAPAAADEGAPCHEPEEKATPCVAHCESSDVSLDKPQVKVFAPAVAAARPAAFAPASYVPPAPLHRTSLPAGPPPRILFQSFLI